MGIVKIADGSECDELTLTSYVSKLQVHYVKKRRAVLLSCARDALTDHSNRLDTATVGAEHANVDGSESKQSDFFSLPAMKITTGAKRVIELAHEAFDEATRSAPDVAYVLYQTSRDIVALLRILTPSDLQGGSGNLSARASSLFHNDCIYAAHELCTMAHTYRNSLPADVASRAVTVDMVPSFRVLAKNTLLAQISIEEASIISVLKAKRIKGTDDEVAQIDGALNSTVLHIERLLGIWHDVLPREGVLGPAIIRLLDTAMREICSKVSSISSIDRSKVRTLRRFLVEFKSSAVDIVNRASAPRGCSSELGSASRADFAELSRFDELCMLLEPHVSLSIITDMCNAGDIKSIEPDQLLGLSRALFSDTASETEWSSLQSAAERMASS